MFTEIAENFQSKFLPFHPYAAIDDRQAFQSTDEAWRKESIRLAESFSEYRFPGMLATDFLEFSRTGNRVHYEDKFFRKRLVLDALVLAECIEDKGRFLDQIIDGIFSICEESAWQLPPHNSYEGTPNFPLPDSTRPVLDLFSCETGAVLACAYDLLQSRLDKISPFICKRIRSELERRIYRPYLDCHFWWMGDGKRKMCNWTIWCTQNVLLSAFFNDRLDPSDAHKIFRKACESIDYFLADYGEDGCCDEGAQYYRHAGLCLFLAIEVLNTVTGGAFDSVYREPKIRNIAEYIFHVHIHDNYFVNFADCSPVAGRAGAREFLFAKRIGSMRMQAFASSDFAAGGLDTLLLPNENNLFYRLQNGFTVSQIREFPKTIHASSAIAPDDVLSKNDSLENKMHTDLYYPSVGLFLARDASLFLAVKAGDNGDSHNHNDVGSFTVYKNGQPLFIDLGVESYTQKTFSKDRYEIWTMQSAYHNLPTINGVQQKDGKEYAAKVLACVLNPDPYIEMDLAGAYPLPSVMPSADCPSFHYIRRAALFKGKEIKIEDRITPFQGNIVLNFMTYEKPILTDTASDSLIFDIGTLGRFTVTGVSFLSIETIPITDPRLQTAWKHEVYRIQLIAAQDTVTMRIS